MKESIKSYIAYDRDDTENAVILVATEDRAFAMELAYQSGGVVYSYDFNVATSTMENETLVKNFAGTCSEG